MGDGRWEMGDGRWEMGDGRWEMGDGRWDLLYLFETEVNTYLSIYLHFLFSNSSLLYIAHKLFSILFPITPYLFPHDLLLLIHSPLDITVSKSLSHERRIEFLFSFWICEIILVPIFLDLTSE
jgi:hypothetical protein